MADFEEACISCGEQTGIGSVFYSDRRVIPGEDDAPVYLCSLCDARIRAARHGRRMTDTEARSLVENGSMAGITWSGGGGTIGF
jgi:hypothetical protein